MNQIYTAYDKYQFIMQEASLDYQWQYDWNYKSNIKQNFIVSPLFWPFKEHP